MNKKAIQKTIAVLMAIIINITIFQNVIVSASENKSIEGCAQYEFEKMMEASPVLEIGSANHICSPVEDNLGVSFLLDYVIKDGIKAGTITKLEVENFEVELWKQILYHRDKWMSAPMEAALKFISEINL